jgi:protein-S-isoprenylcysteine O-methyltransferase Ste14
VTPIESFFIILLAFALYGLVHSWLASMRFKQWLRGKLGEPWVQRYYRLVFNILGTVTLLPILWLAAVLPDRLVYVIPYPWRWLSYAGQVLGIWILWASLRQTGTMDFLGLRQIVQPEAKAPALTVGGMYARMRHPLYTGSMLALWLLPQITSNLLALNLGISLYFWIGAIFEERKLARQFGQAYKDYQARTPMFVPRPGGPAA